MAIQWGIPKSTEEIVKERDTKCVYCGVVFSTEEETRKDKPSIRLLLSKSVYYEKQELRKQNGNDKTIILSKHDAFNIVLM